MQKLKLNNQGFHVLPLIVIVVVVGLIWLVGLRVFNLQQGSTTEGQAVQTATSALQTPPGGWKMYADETVGVQFAYPDVYGVFTPQMNIGNFESILASDRLKTNYLPGVAGTFSLKTYKKGVMEIQPRKDGPEVKLLGSEWSVTRPNENDSRNYEKGDIYSEMKRTNTHGLEAYGMETGDEGIMTYRLYFVTEGKLRMLELPPFDSEQYSTTYNINDRGPYDAMFVQVRDSIRLY